jgi:Trypsin-co-occurring domain 2
MTRDDGPWVGLADAVAGIRSELAEAIADGKDKEPKFEVGEITMEFAVELRKERGIDGGVRVWVLDASGSKSSEHADTHRLTVTLTPKSAGRPVQVGSGSRMTARPDR